MEEKNYYQILNLDRNANGTEIKSAYLREARIYHPDHHNGNEDEFVKKFQDIMEAYKVLSDPKTKASYDRSLELKNHMVVVNPALLETRFASILDKSLNSSSDFSSLKREFSFSNSNSSRSAQYSNGNNTQSNNNNAPVESNNSYSYSNSDDTKRVKLESVFQFSRQGDSFTFHRQPIGESSSSTSLNSTASSDYARNSIPSNSMNGKCNSAPILTMNPTNSVGNTLDMQNKSMDGANLHKSTDQQTRTSSTVNSSSSTTLLPSSVVHVNNNNSIDYSKLKLPSFNLNNSNNSNNSNNNSLSNIQQNLSMKYNNNPPLPSPSNLLNSQNPMLSSTGNLSTTSQSMYDASVTLQTSISISFQDSVYGCIKNILIKRQSICTHCNNSFNNLNNSSNSSMSNINILHNQNSNGNVNLIAPLNDHSQKHNSSSHLPNYETNQPFIFSSSNNSSSNVGNKEFILPPLSIVNSANNEICKNCNGKGLYIADARIAVNVPAGVLNGSRQILVGEGEVSSSGKKGDLIVIFNVESHPFLRRVGTRDVTCDLPLSISQTTLGSTLQIPSIYGTVQVEIPSGTQHGEIIKLLDKGFSDPTEPSVKGNMCIRILVQIPTKLTPRQRELLEEFERISQEKQL